MVTTTVTLWLFVTAIMGKAINLQVAQVPLMFLDGEPNVNVSVQVLSIYSNLCVCVFVCCMRMQEAFTN